MRLKTGVKGEAVRFRTPLLSRKAKKFFDILFSLTEADEW